MKDLLLTQTPFKKETVDKIVLGIQTATDASELKFFQYEFYNRFAGYVYKAALHHFKLYDGTQFLAKETLQETFIKAFAKIDTFRFPLNAMEADYPKIIRAWLGKIALNESKRATGKIINEKVQYDSLNTPELSYDPFEDIYGEDKEEVPNEFQLLLQEAMNKLSKKEIDIILTYAGEGCIETTKHLSKNSLQSLCEYYKTTPEAIRQCKKRALDKIKKICFR
jgi:RNA polymerase sigma factor (sigma-70 family)